MVPVGGSMAELVVVVVVVVEVPVVLVVPVVPGVLVVPEAASRLNVVPWRKPETTALACSVPPRNSANSALSFASVLVDVPMVEVVVAVVGVAVVVVVVGVAVVVVVVDVVVPVSAAWAAKAAARQHASTVERMFG
jgi:hypothetical protein